MRATLDTNLSFLQTLRDELGRTESGAATIVTADGVRHAIHEPVTIGADYIAFSAYGTGPESPKAIIPFATMASLIV